LECLLVCSKFSYNFYAFIHHVDQPMIVTRVALVSCSILTTGVGGSEYTVSPRINAALDSNREVTGCRGRKYPLYGSGGGGEGWGGIRGLGSQ
jgi:hypothetical protein